MSNPTNPQIYRSLVIQLTRLKKLQESDVFEDLTDLDYLANLEKKSEGIISNLVSQGLIPNNFEEHFFSDLKRVCFIRDQFKKDSGKLGFLLEQANNFNAKFLDLEFQFGPNEIEEASEALIEFEKEFKNIFQELKRLHYGPDWNPEGKLDPYLLEYYNLEKSDNFHDNVNSALISFVKSPIEFNDIVTKLIDDCKKVLEQKLEHYRQAKTKESQIQQLYNQGKLEQLRATIEETRFFKGVAENEKSKLELYDRLLEEKKLLRYKLDLLVEQDDYDGIRKFMNEFQQSSAKLNGFLNEKLDSKFMLDEYRKALALEKTSHKNSSFSLDSTPSTNFTQLGTFLFFLILILILVTVAVN